MPINRVYRDNLCIIVHYRQTRDGYSIVIKEKRLKPEEYTMYVYHMFITYDLVVTHAHFKYKVEAPKRWWLELRVGEKININKLIKLIRGEM